MSLWKLGKWRLDHKNQAFKKKRENTIFLCESEETSVFVGELQISLKPIPFPYLCYLQDLLYRVMTSWGDLFIKRNDNVHRPSRRNVPGMLVLKKVWERNMYMFG